MAFFQPNEWLSSFFGRPFYYGELNVELENLLGALETELESLKGVPGLVIEAKINSQFFENIPFIEDIGFRFVDSRLEFETLTQRTEFKPRINLGKFRLFKDSDYSEVRQLTINELVSNPTFRSRFKNRRYFNEEESERYYLQWHEWVLKQPKPMFCIWEVEGVVAGFYTILRFQDNLETPRYKVALAAVSPTFRSFSAQNEMQQWLFSIAPDDEWITINSPALTNLPGLKNNIKAGKRLHRVESFFYL